MYDFKQTVNLFHREIRSLNIEPPDDGDESKVENGIKHVVLPIDVGDGGRSGDDNYVDEKPVDSCSKGCADVAHFLGVDSAGYI
jgi:hypothetical protein